jgi:hypothetical protein
MSTDKDTLVGISVLWTANAESLAKAQKNKNKETAGGAGARIWDVRRLNQARSTSCNDHYSNQTPCAYYSTQRLTPCPAVFHLVDEAHSTILGM